MAESLDRTALFFVYRRVLGSWWPRTYSASFNIASLLRMFPECPK
jgi:hypothetical protein